MRQHKWSNFNGLGAVLGERIGDTPEVSFNVDEYGKIEDVIVRDSDGNPVQLNFHEWREVMSLLRDVYEQSVN